VTLWEGREFCEELAAVGALLSHAVPSGKKEEVLSHVLRAQRKVLERRRHGSPQRTTQPAVQTHENARYIPASLRREVYDREGGTCAYVGEEARRCHSTRQLEYQHLTPVARGGRTTADNLTLFCRAHNLLQAEKDFGAAHVTQRRAVAALTNLGYKRAQAEHAIRQLPPTDDLSTLVRDCLRLLE
jgi:5-methylcytosine-specific restriction endonuclease McrA